MQSLRNYSIYLHFWESLFIAVSLILVSACSALPGQIGPGNDTTVLQAEQKNANPVPKKDHFSSLPFHLIGETVEAGGYIIALKNISIQSSTILVSATLTNNTQSAVELSNVLTLYSQDGPRIAPEKNDAVLSPGSTLQADFIYTLSQPLVQADIMDYRLLYTPFGWSGPVIVYLLVNTLPDVSPPPTLPAQDIPTQISKTAYNGSTGDPWKMLVLIYPNIDTDYVENGQIKHLTASMPATDISAMRTNFVNNQPHRKVVYGYSDNTAEMEANIIIVDRPLTNLMPDGWGGFWPSPEVTGPDLDLYAPNGQYDSVIIFWQASDSVTGKSLPVGGWGLGYWPGDLANGMTYATVFNLSLAWPNDKCKGEVFLHEWLHGVTGFYKDHLGFSFNVDDLHGAEEAGYQWDYDQDGCWDMWLRDYMRGLVYENGQRKALVPQTWQSGSITTHQITGWRGEYFGNETLTDIPILVRDDPQIIFDWKLDSPHPLVPSDHFSVRWTKETFFTTGNYSFKLLHDQGIRLKIDDTTVLDAWDSMPGWVSYDKDMEAGYHVIVVEYREIDGLANANFDISLPVTIAVSITRANPNPTSAAGVDFTVAFSESVKDVDKNDFALTTTGALNGVSVTSVSGGPSLYTVSVNTGTGSGDLRLDLPASATITNLSGTPLTGLPYTSGESYTVDKTVAASGLLQLQGIPVENSQACASVNASGGGAFGGGFFGPVYTDRNGAFTLFGLPIVDTYTFRSTYPGYLMAEKAGVSVMSPLDLGKATLRGGDVNGDNAVNILDIGRILSLFGHAGVPVRSVNCSDPDEAVDINNDGLVNISDLAITAGNWGKTGPTPWQP